MPEFCWKAAYADGRISEGRMDAPGQADVVRQLRMQGLVPVSVVIAPDEVNGSVQNLPVPAPGQTSAFWRRKNAPGGSATSADVLTLTSELSIMLRAGLSLDNALRVLIGMTHKPAVSTVTAQILVDVKGGVALSKALGRHRDLFGDFYINMVRSGEASGQLGAVFERLVEHMERLRALRESVVSAAIYPAILLGVAVLSLGAMLGFVVPQFETLFKDMGDALPAPTRFVMQLGQVFTQYGWVIVLAGAMGVGVAELVALTGRAPVVAKPCPALARARSVASQI